MSLLTVRLVTCIVLNKKLSIDKIKTPILCGDSEKLSNKKKSNATWSYIYSVYVKQMSFLKYKYGTIHTVQPINLYHTHSTLCSSKTKVSNTLNSVPNFSVKSLFSGAFNVHQNSFARMCWCIFFFGSRSCFCNILRSFFGHYPEHKHPHYRT